MAYGAKAISSVSAINNESLEIAIERNNAKYGMKA